MIKLAMTCGGVFPQVSAERTGKVRWNEKKSDKRRKETRKGQKNSEKNIRKDELDEMVKK